MPPSTFREWMRTPPPANADARGAWIERGVSLAAVRRERMTGWIQNDPERALAEAVTPRQYERLPAEVRALIERPVSEEGFYGVLAVCGHGPGETHSRACEIRHEVVLEFGTPASESYNAAIHGARRERMTEENAAINGVALDKWIALYPGDVVIHDDGPAFEPNRYSVYHKGPVGTASDRTSAEALAADVPPPTP
jgi:hypothetical protein